VPASPSIRAELLGTRFRFETAAGLFSADRVDEGTRLLLDHLPPGSPGSVLDLGCGYGALGLPIAARHPAARCTLVDRNLLAVACAARNAEHHGLTRVQASASLGYRDLPPEARFDWILCNIPARIGDGAIDHLLQEGRRRLLPGGSLHIVVIRDLVASVEQMAARHGWPLENVASGARHQVLGLPPNPTAAASNDFDSFYLRDRVQVGSSTLERPFDLSEEPAHLHDALPLLLDVLPKSPGPRALVWRGGYGAAACMLAQRGAAVVAADADLLATTFTQRNARAISVSLETRDALTPEGALAPGMRFDCIVGELAPHLDTSAATDEVGQASRALRSGGSALWLGLTRQGRSLLERGSAHKRLRFNALAQRGAYSVWRVQPAPTLSPK
jgi:16S rRNA (guanine1207-N2)-methyltransferase